MISVTSWWVEQSQSLTSDLRRELIFTSSLDGNAYNLSHLVSKWPSAKRKAGSFDPGSVEVDLATADLDQRFAAFGVLDADGARGTYPYSGIWDIKVGYVHTNSGPEMVSMFSGRLQKREFEPGFTKFKIAPEADKMLTVDIGDSSTPIRFGAHHFELIGNPADIAWEVCSMAGLSTLASAANPDIDYASWDAWSDHFDNYSPWTCPGCTMFGYATGQKGTALLKEILKQSHSIAGIGGDGRIRFAGKSGINTAVATIDTSIIIKANYDEDISLRPTVAKIVVYSYGTIGAPARTYRYTATNTNAKAIYGEREEQWDSSTIGHCTSFLYHEYASAYPFIENHAGDQAAIPMTANLTMPFCGFLIDVCDEVVIEDTINNVSSYHWTVTEVQPDLNNATVKLKLEERREVVA